MLNLLWFFSFIQVCVHIYTLCVCMSAWVQVALGIEHDSC